MAIYTLPDLPYDYSALEPYISGKIMELHHDKHHMSYVTGANQAMEQIHEAASSGDVATVNQISKNLAFNLGGHKNHSIFWKNMAPASGQVPTGEFEAALIDRFGSVEGFKTYFSAVAAGVQGSGWAVLAWDTLGEQLVVVQLYDQQGNLPVSIIPVIMLDCWEHAYYLDYLNVRADYIKAWWNVLNWQDAGERFDEARAVSAKLVK
jgi:Fe-Mn family superoxide dismutase